MQAQAAKKTKKAAQAERAPPAAALLMTPILTSEVYLQRKACACGGSCPRCQAQAKTPERKIQPKLIVGPVGDSFEQEADRVATQVMRMDDKAAVGIGSAAPQVQRACSACEPEKHTDARVQRDAATPEEASAEPAPAIAPAQLTAGGDALNADTRRFFESRFNRDLSAVRWHRGGEANAYCAQLNAHAFTYGNHIWLGGGLSATPSFVMAHELAHVVQQTQPKTLAGHAGAPRQAAAARAVQRLPFWVPLHPALGRAMKGAELHKELLEAVNGQKQIEIEAPVPNATRNQEGLGLQGFADLYRAKSRVGVYFNPRQGLAVGDTEGNERHTHPARTKKAGRNPKPVATKTGGIDKIGDGPPTVELGELKPAAKTELGKGDTQLKHYEAGFKDAAALTNMWAATRRYKNPTDPKPEWKLTSVSRLPDADITPAPQHHPDDAATGADRLLVLADIDENAPKRNQSDARSKYTVKTLYMPKVYLGEEIRGKLYMQSAGNGLWMYYARPKDLSKVLDLPGFKRAAPYATVAAAVVDEVIGPLKHGPEQVQTLARANPVPALAKAPPRIFRKKKTPTKLKDHFDAKAYDTWSKRQTALGKEVRGKDPTKPTASAFKKLEFLEAAVKAENSVSPTAKAKTKDFPTAAELKETIQAGGGKTKAPKVTKDIQLNRLFDWLSRWTSAPYKVLGKFRQIFGTGFVAAVNKFEKIKEGISTKLHEFFNKRTKAKKTAGLLAKALGRALKQVIEIIVPQTVSLVKEAVGRGIKKKLEALFADTFVESSIQKFQAWQEEIKNYGEQAKAYIEKVKNEYLKKFDWVDDLLDKVKWFWRVVKTGRTLLKCRKPPILGCLALLKDAAKDHELNCVLCIPWVQKQVAQRVLAVQWFQDMPVNLGNLILGTLHDAVPEKAAILRDIFAEKIAKQSMSVEDLTPDCDVKCTGFGLFKTGGPGGAEVSKEDVDKAEKMSDFSDKLSKEQIEELLKEAERQGMLDKPFDQKQAEDLLKESEKKRKEREAEEAAKPKEGKAPPEGAEPAAPPKQPAEPTPTPEPAPEAKPEAKPKPAPKPKPKPEAKPEPKPEAKPKPKPKPKPAKPGPGGGKPAPEPGAPPTAVGRPVPGEGIQFVPHVENCFGVVRRGEPMSTQVIHRLADCGIKVLKPPFCTTTLSFGVHFYPDHVNVPVPRPFKPPRLRVFMEFISPDGKRRTVHDVSDAKPVDQGAGQYFKPSFGDEFKVSTATDGTLEVQIEMLGMSGRDTIYTDTIPIKVEPCA